FGMDTATAALFPDSFEDSDLGPIPKGWRVSIVDDVCLFQNGYAFKTPQELFAMHEEWFKDQNWIWEGTPVNTAVGEDMAFALIKYEYRAKKEDVPFSTWLTYVFRLEDGEWRLIHDQNTALDFNAFAKSAGLNSD
ncbi:MAG TPA: DUF4440 domain-containing protein, partial [Leptospiraceae bacterium]|nr:DUF4440 domain-containing protein [Leptospiraceae bacterium]